MGVLVCRYIFNGTGFSVHTAANSLSKKHYSWGVHCTVYIVWKIYERKLLHCFDLMCKCYINGNGKYTTFRSVELTAMRF